MPISRLTGRHLPYQDYRPGDVVSVPFGGVLSHYGVVTSRGTVISNSRKNGGVVEQDFAEFENGKSVRLHRRDSSLSPRQVEMRARRALGADYDLVGSNCIHFARHVHRRRATPLQVGKATLHALGDMISGPRHRF